MFEVVFYKDKNGKEPVLDYLRSLNERSDKDSRVKLNKIRDYIKVLQLHGTKAGEPYMKHLEGEIWELRPLRDRILFAAWSRGQFVLLHCFMKKTQKTPKREIEHAKRYLQDFAERSHEYE
ncbi:MAG: type II toxin-antitoxin system RelE/ParE family toxin [Saccharofermentanales bacterium]|nr:type II toxin-antitoxin system RelE/ParE family toxin [Bacillota bacterium]NLB09094.1 type II toxin-antitoxin system RelE/ParE family toxin [Clostridiales bacterium]